jgi:transposase
LIRKRKTDLQHVLFCFENTGIYGLPLASFLSDSGIDYWEVPALEIKRAKGISRGKNDKIDSQDIAFYAHTHKHKMKLTKMPEREILELRLLFSEREKLLKAIKLFGSTKEVEGFIDKKLSRDVLSVNKKVLRQLNRELNEVEQKMKVLIKSNLVMTRQNELIQSVCGVGPQTAVYIILTTKCFTAFSNWRKMACYSGIAPFEYKSGSSIRRRTRVNHMADKKMKSLLTMCALNAKRHDKEIALYYKRKIEEGKHPMLVMNAIKCKVLSRIFATVNRGTPYVNTHEFAA